MQGVRGPAEFSGKNALVSREQSEKESSEESRRSGDRRKHNLQVENDKRSSDRRDLRGINGLIEDIFAED
jgi:hypothetical protein